MKKNLQEKKVINFLIRIFWVFIIGSVFGFLIEMLYVLVYTRNLEIRQGLIYGPFIQVYGMGAVAYYLLVDKVKEPKQVFFCGMIMGGAVEYLFSFFQELIWGTVSWDYSKFFFNLNGRTCLLYCVYWGLIGIVFLKIVYPCFQQLDSLIYKKSVRIITIFLAIFMAYDITISSMAVTRQQQRKDNIPPRNSVDVFLDKAYPDEYLNKIYHNTKDVTELEE